MIHVTGILENMKATEKLFALAESRGFSLEDISLIAEDTPDHGQEVVRETEDASRGAIGGLSGAAFIPIVFVFLSSFGLIGFGPLVAALSIGGTVAGGVLGAFVGHGLSTALAQEYETAIRKGNVIAAIHVGTERIRDAERLLLQAGARRIADSLHLSSSNTGELAQEQE